jgi:uncharacterized protein YebE (UPF0316 family)
MNSTLAESLRIDPTLFHYILLPILIFMARILDVSINTIRIIFMLHGKKSLATLLGFFESLIWLLAISQIFQNLSSWPTYIAYAGGFATGILVGMLIEEKLAIGNVVIRVITQKPADELTSFLSENKYRHAVLDAVSSEGNVNVIFTVTKRENLHSILSVIKSFNPNAFYTVEGVKKVSDEDISDERGFLFRRIFPRRTE